MKIFRVMAGCILLYVATTYVRCESGKKTRWEDAPRIRSSVFLRRGFAALITEREGAALVTSDSGNNWQRTAGVAVGDKFDALSFTDSFHGWAVNNKGQIWKSDDAGKSWKWLSNLNPDKGDDWQFNSGRQVHFVDDKNGWIIETLTIWRTIDGGMSWRSVFSGASKSNPLAQPTAGYFLDAMFALVPTTTGAVYRTSNGGQSWEEQTLLPNGNLSGIDCVNRKLCWVIGYSGGQSSTQVFKTDDGGQSWAKYTISDVQLRGIGFIDEREGWAVGSENTPPGSSENVRAALLRTNDGGHIWRHVKTAPNDRFFDMVHFVDSKTGWLIGRDNVYQTTDGGEQWRAVLALPSISDNKSP